MADFATYSALRSSLYQQVDQQLAGHRPGVAVYTATGAAACSSPTGGLGPGSAGGPAGIPGGGVGGPNVFGYSYGAYVNASGKVLDGLECPAYVGSHSYRPQLPDPIGGFTTQPDGTQEVYFTASSIDPNGPAFRVRAVKEQQGVIALVAQPLVDQTSTLHTLFLTEFAVTAGALVLALAGGWWLVRLGLRPLEDVEATAESIAAGNLDQRVPGADQPTEVGRLGPRAQRDARTHPGCVLGPRCIRTTSEGIPGPPAPLRGRRIARAADAHRRRVGLRRALRARRRHQRG